MAKKKKSHPTHKQLDDAIRKTPPGAENDPVRTVPPPKPEPTPDGSFDFQGAEAGGDDAPIKTAPPDSLNSLGGSPETPSPASSDVAVDPVGNPTPETETPGDDADAALKESIDEAIERIWRESDESSSDADDMAEIQMDCLIGKTREERGERLAEEWVPEWYLRTMVKLEAEEAKVKKQMDLILHQIDARRRGMEYRFKALMERITRQLLEQQGGKKKSVDLPFGRLGFRTAGDKVEIDSDDANLKKLRKWLADSVEDKSITKAEADGIRSIEKIEKEKISKKAILALLESKGLIPDGVEHTGPKENWFFKV